MTAKEIREAEKEAVERARLKEENRLTELRRQSELLGIEFVDPKPKKLLFTYSSSNSLPPLEITDNYEYATLGHLKLVFKTNKVPYRLFLQATDTKVQQELLNWREVGAHFFRSKVYQAKWETEVCLYISKIRFDSTFQLAIYESIERIPDDEIESHMLFSSNKLRPNIPTLSFKSLMEQHNYTNTHYSISSSPSSTKPKIDSIYDKLLSTRTNPTNRPKSSNNRSSHHCRSQTSFISTTLSSSLLEVPGQRTQRRRRDSQESDQRDVRNLDTPRNFIIESFNRFSTSSDDYDFDPIESPRLACYNSNKHLKQLKEHERHNSVWSNLSDETIISQSSSNSSNDLSSISEHSRNQAIICPNMDTSGNNLLKHNEIQITLQMPNSSTFRMSCSETAAYWTDCVLKSISEQENLLNQQVPLT